MTCSCGEPHPHVVMERQTIDGVTVRLWSDGTFGTRFSALEGLPHRPRKNVDMPALWRFMGSVELLERSELGVEYQRAIAPPRLSTPRDSGFKFVWEVTCADRDGKPTERWCHLPRLRWPGLAVLDECNRKPRYSLLTIRHGTAYPTGFRFDTLGSLREHLETHYAVEMDR